ncbi:hypothetical protein J2Z58_002785 [Halobacillus andaensis]|nr:hypothetical protein [Halobacillus andaensis]
MKEFNILQKKIKLKYSKVKKGKGKEKNLKNNQV